MALIASHPPSSLSATSQVTAWYNEAAHVDVALYHAGRTGDWLVASAMSARSPQVVITADMGDLTIPSGFRRAIDGPQADRWKEAIAKELGGLIALGTWEIVPASSMPSGSNLMNCHFVFTVKRKADGSIEKFKARLVADGNTQKFGVDFDRVFATVVKTLTIRLVLAIAAARDYNLTSIDIRQAYLQAELKDDLYMRIPPGLPPRPGYVCKLKRSLYGLKQAGREWANLFAQFLITWGLVRSTIDICLYTYSLASKILWVLIYVDDALIVDNDKSLRSRFVHDLSARFPVEDKGELSWILNVAIRRDRSARKLILSQELYVDDLLSKCDGFLSGSTTRRFDSPLDEHVDLAPETSPEVGSDEYVSMNAQRQLYMSLVGGLLWLANMTRPDIAFAASQLARVLGNPGRHHVRSAARVLIYLRGTKARALVYQPNPDLGLDTYVDSDWAVKFSCSGSMFFLHGCLIQWFSKLQRSVSLSSAEAEFFGAMLCARELTFIRDLLVDLGFALSAPSPVFSDSKSAIDMSYDPVAFKKTKHILRAANFLRDLVEREVLVLYHIAGTNMLADILTKAVARQTFMSLIKMLDDYIGYRTGAIPATSTSKSLLVQRPRVHMVRRHVTFDVCGECDDDESECGVAASVTPPPTPSPSVPPPVCAAPSRWPRPGNMIAYPIWPSNSPYNSLADERRLASVRRFGPLSQHAICFCQCPHAPHGCAHEVLRSENTIYCDFCYFEHFADMNDDEDDEDTDVELGCECFCSGCEPPVFPCARDDCPCDASWNGKPGEFCCRECSDGVPCATPTHARPSSWPSLG
jgi:hypothetical protein